MLEESVDVKRDLPPRREVPTDTGNKYIIERRDPFGLWFVHMEKGQVPEQLKGAFTSVELARKAVDLYTSQTKKKN